MRFLSNFSVDKSVIIFRVCVIKVLHKEEAPESRLLTGFWGFQKDAGDRNRTGTKV